MVTSYLYTIQIYLLLKHHVCHKIFTVLISIQSDSFPIVFIFTAFSAAIKDNYIFKFLKF